MIFSEDLVNQNDSNVVCCPDPISDILVASLSLCFSPSLPPSLSLILSRILTFFEATSLQ